MLTQNTSASLSLKIKLQSYLLNQKIFLIESFTSEIIQILSHQTLNLSKKKKQFQKQRTIFVNLLFVLPFYLIGYFNFNSMTLLNCNFVNQNNEFYQLRSRIMDNATLGFIYFLAVIGGIWFIVLITKLLWNLIKIIIPAKNYLQRYGVNTWAVVTGGSDGLGLGFCQQLAQLGFNICMIARNKNKMEAALEKLKFLNEKQQIKTKAVVADFTQCQNPDFFPKLFKQLQGLNISILVNNVGISNIGLFHQIPDKRVLNEVNVNILPMTMMTHHIINQMLKRQQRSAIMNISSFSAQHPIPYISTYCSTKVYNDYFSRSLQMQYSHKIDILSVRPLYIETNMSKQKKSCTVAGRNDCARAALGYLGIDYETNGIFMHKLMATVTGCLPEPIIRCLSQSSSRQIMQKEKQQALLPN